MCLIWGAYAKEVQKLIGTRRLKLVLEPGRSLVGNAGALLTRVEFVKHGEEKNFVMVDAAMNDLMRPALYDAYHHIEAVETKNIEPLTANIVGPICETGDFLGKDRTIACEEGIYCLSAAPVRMVQAWRATTTRATVRRKYWLTEADTNLSANVKPSSSKWPTNWLVCKAGLLKGRLKAD